MAIQRDAAQPRIGLAVCALAWVPIIAFALAALLVPHPPTSPVSLTQFFRDILSAFSAQGQFNALYLALLLASLLAFAAIVWRTIRGNAAVPIGASIAAYIGAMALLYLPALAGGALNPDESQQLSVALTWAQHANYFAVIDAGTHGPLINVPLTGSNMLTGHWLAFDYGLAHLWALIFLILIPIIWLQTARAFVPSRIALIGILPIFALNMQYMAGRNVDFLAYNAHHVSMLLLSGALSLGLLSYRAANQRRALLLLLLSGFCLGAMAYAKMQWMPLATIIALGFVGSLWLLARDVRWARIAVFIAGGIGALMLGIVLLACTGYLADFFKLYVLGQVNYAGANSRWPKLSFILWALRTPSAATNGAYLILLVLAGLLISRALAAKAAIQSAQTAITPSISLAPAPLRLLVIILVMLNLLALFSVIAPGNYSSHYAFLTLFAAQLSFYILFCLFVPKAPGAQSQRWIIASASIALGYIALQWGGLLANPKGLLSLTAYSEPWKKTVALKAVCSETERQKTVSAIMQNTDPKDGIAIWGWDYDLFVQAQRHNVNKSNVNAFLNNAAYGAGLNDRFGDAQNYALRYVAEIERARPKIVVDAVAPSAFFFDDPKSQSVKALPSLSHILQRDYAPKQAGCLTLWMRKTAP